MSTVCELHGSYTGYRDCTCEIAMRTKFDKAYYDKFYRDPSTRAVSPSAAKRQAEFIAAYLAYLEIQVHRFIDVGCGVGNVLRALTRVYPRAEGTGIEYSDYLCKRYGWTQGSVTDYKPDKPADLVICNDVLAYLADATCEAAIRNLAGMTGGALFLGVLTEEDLAVCDRQRTDNQQVIRPSAWYQRRLNPSFTNVGGGLHLRTPLNVTVWSLDRLQ
ncbi:MAG: class I SAM-dependent methyltransferase [Gammaproteobacteria bacterium]|nr:class I SAM-dependent methyltransferase [Gammaproteobacteria bacterium]